jgi:hypothetical protein
MVLAQGRDSLVLRARISGRGEPRGPRGRRPSCDNFDAPTAKARGIPGSSRVLAMTTHAVTVEAQLSPGVTFRAPHGRKVLACHPGEGTMARRLLASLAADAALRCRSTRATHGIGFTHRPPRWNRQPIGHVKVPSCGTTMANAVSNVVRLKPTLAREGLIFQA